MADTIVVQLDIYRVDYSSAWLINIIYSVIFQLYGHKLKIMQSFAGIYYVFKVVHRQTWLNFAYLPSDTSYYYKTKLWELSSASQTR